MSNYSFKSRTQLQNEKRQTITATLQYIIFIMNFHSSHLTTLLIVYLVAPRNFYFTVLYVMTDADSSKRSRL